MSFPTVSLEISDMNSRCLFSFTVCLLMIRGSQTCSKLELIQGSDRRTIGVGSVMNITFRLDTHQCPSTQTSYIITVSWSFNGSHIDICKLRMQRKCVQSAFSASCFCMSPDGPMLFSKKVSSDDNNTVYMWKWNDIIAGEQYKEIPFQIYNVGSTTDVAHSTTDVADSTTHVAHGTTDVADSTTHVAHSTTDVTDSTTHVAHSTTFQTSIAIAISGVSSGGGVLLVTGLIVITAYVCRRRGRNHFGQNPSPTHSYASSIHCPAGAFTTHSEQTTDTYETIENKADSTAPCRSGVKLLLSANLKRDNSTSTLVNQNNIPVCQIYNDGYLHPLYLPGVQPEQKIEFKTMCSMELPSVKPKVLRSSV